jgi:hypothetical protein
MISDDDCVAGLHKFIAIISWILYSLKGDLGSFLAQSKNHPSFDIEARYALHSKNNIPEALQKLGEGSVEAKSLILGSSYPETIKIKWLKCLSLYQDALKNFLEHEIHSEPEEYINTAENFMKIVNSFQKLTENFSASVELVTVGADRDQGLQHLQELEVSFSEVFELTQKHGFITKLNSEQKKELREQLIGLAEKSSS